MGGGVIVGVGAGGWAGDNSGGTAKLGRYIRVGLLSYTIIIDNI